jgi:creatinine amidohydrolase/Fe(II)-dependent formamide hydrolase-like protein
VYRTAALHVPVDNDTWFAEQLLLETAAQLGDVPDVVLPAAPVGPTSERF